MELATILDQLGLVAGFSEAEKDALAHALWEQRHPDGHVFVRQGERTSYAQPALHLILEGKVLVTVDPAEPEARGVVRLLEEGEMFGLIALVDEGEREGTVRAAGPVRTASMSRQAFDALYRADGRLATHFQFAVARQLARDLRGSDAELKKALVHARMDALAQDDDAGG